VAVAAETLRTLSGLVAGFLAGHPGVSFRLFQSPAPAMAAQLQAGEVDLGLASQPLPGPALTSVELLSEEVLLAVPPAHRLAGRTRATVGELAGEPFVTTRPGYWQRALTDRIFTDPVIVCEGDEPYAIRGLISAGVGIGLMPAMARRLAADPPVGWLHLDVPCRRTLSLAWRTDAYQPAAARALTDFAAGFFRTWRGDA
jgi:DNA-binding transcriptional LysR family regulator